MTDNDLIKEIAFCDECISHLLENVGPDHIIVKYRNALTYIARIEAAYLKTEAEYIWQTSDPGYDFPKCKEMARESLERIKAGDTK